MTSIENDMFVNLTHNKGDLRADALKNYFESIGITFHGSESREELVSVAGKKSGYDYDAVVVMPNSRNMIGDTPASTLFSTLSKTYPNRAYLGLLNNDVDDPLSVSSKFQTVGKHKGSQPREIVVGTKPALGRLYSERNTVQAVTLLSSGADDVIRIGDQLHELSARMLAVRARKIGAVGSIIRFGTMAVHLDEPLVTVLGNDIGLTRTEYAIVKYMAMRPTKACSRPEILEALGKDHLEADKVIDVFICKIRQKIAEASGGVNNIKTVWGQGTILEALDSPAKAAEHLGSTCRAAPSSRILAPS